MSEFPIEFSSTMGALAGALAAAQGELQDAKKDSINPHFRNKFASLSSVREAITPIFVKNGLSVAQCFEPHGLEGVCVVTMLMHKSGEWLKSRLYLPVTKKDPQGFGSAISYGRRYALAAIANIATDDDDDAQVASLPAKTEAKTEAKSTVPAEAVDVEKLIKSLENAKTTKALSEAALVIGRMRSKLSNADHQRLLAAHDATMKALES